MKILIIVDPQYDFLDENGSLYVKNDHLTESISDYAIYHKDFDRVFITMDSHPINHCSFIQFGGQFPTHCVEGSLGASYDNNILSIIDHYRDKYTIISKGGWAHQEEFGAFGSTHTISLFKLLLLSNKEENSIEICGVAGDYCVKETISNLLNNFKGIISNEDIYVLEDLVVSIDDGTTLREFIREKGIQVINELRS